MKKWTIGLGTALAAGVLAAGMAVSAGAAPASGGGIGQEKAEQIAADHAGVKKDDILYIFSELDYEDGRKVYEVEFYTKDYREYDYEISAADGAVISCDYDAETSFWKNIPDRDRTVQITEEKAQEIALNHAGKKAEDVRILRMKLDYDDGMAVYEVEFFAGENEEYDYEISAWTGEIISRDYDAESRGERWAKAGAERREAAAGTAALTAEEAKAAALKDAGLKESQVEGLRVHQDWDDGRVVYEGKFYYHELEYEFEVDGNTGRLIDWDVESIYD